ncbi:hypothetical protein [Agromyces sp. SYSU T00194]|uniref:hypothetical protein n=1 Tax=Agromyces chitinivorans TaxID=3158560 RepID=UPI0033943C96
MRDARPWRSGRSPTLVLVLACVEVGASGKAPSHGRGHLVARSGVGAGDDDRHDGFVQARVSCFDGWGSVNIRHANAVFSCTHT